MAIDLNKFKKINSTHTTVITRNNQKKILGDILNKNTPITIKR